MPRVQKAGLKYVSLIRDALPANPLFWFNEKNLSYSEENEEKYKITPAGIKKIEKHIIPSAKKTELRKTLRRLNITAATLFPDMDHIALELKSAWGL